jgi:glutamate---cysteine ligase / carboxylate-amine ligase
MVYWDVRPSAHLPTVEVRVSDVPSTVDEAVLLATLVRALVATAVRDLEAGRTAAPISPEILRAAHWRGARDGLRGHALDPLSLRLTSFAERLGALLEHVRPALKQFGDVNLRRLVRSVLARGNGAVRQRRALSLRGAVVDVVDRAARATVQGLPPDSPPSG